MMNQPIQNMKKTVFTLLLTMVAAVALNAQSLTGKQWCTKLADDDGTEVVVALTFEEDGTCEMLAGTEYEMKEDGVPINLTGMVTVPGTYTLKDKNLKLKLNKRKAVVDLDYDIKGMDAKTKALMDKEIRDEINSLKNEFRDMMLEGMLKLQNLKIVSLKSKELILRYDGGDEIPFYAE